ncbi:N-acetylmuramoyl-L-alanine amidase [Falsochrobactrum sp. TDYN1]|uniref:N-acetylmuramoyl-L-alanine amidase n=1 Tax=Falsochrobactrum tianjinense TaxID=2706015 RepID=A0A949PND4_9HYPH|nr:N-acetylmuramoyl-L-alanine amidase [Falsochrobactrum sp. TDYN1]MBV2143943.1 N-acetylmuramoyl-L-alanine amidase [Falsochrobactrum sp. TDYN1]
MSGAASADENLFAELALTAPDYPGATLDPSPNFGPRRDGKTPAFLILHYTGLPTAEEALEILKSPEREVSAHYLVHEDGEVVQMVSEKARAWHAGKSFWKGEIDLNSASIGIEIVNPGELENYPPFKEPQIEAVICLCRSICERYEIRSENVLAHSDIAPVRKNDPGHNFPWKRLHDAGIGHFIEPTPIRGGRFLARGEQGQPVEALQSMLALYGYEIQINGLFDEQTEIVIKAFQRHFRPQNVDGVADVSTIDTLYRLLFSLQNVTA